MKRYLFSRLSLYLLFISLVIFPAMAAPVYADGQTVFGPKDLTIGRWHFHLSTHKFEANDPGDGVVLITKSTPEKKIRRGFILLNSDIAPLRDFLVGDDLVFEREVSLRSTNYLVAFLVGTPGASITIEVKSSEGPIPPPQVTFSADPASIILGETSTLTWSASNADSVSIDQGVGDVPLEGSIPVSPAETTTYTITATGPGGTATDSVMVTVTSGLTLTIISPSDGDTISRADVMVEGTISNPTGNETGVTLNGIVAMAYGDQFVANHVPVEEGENTITATATDTDGNTGTVSITVNAVTTEDYIKLEADPESGVSPLETMLRIEGSFSFTESSLTYTGPGEVEILENPSPEEYRVRITTEGIYEFTAEVMDEQNNAYTDTTAIVVLDRAELDAMLKAKWEGMKSALANQDIEKALNYFAEDTQGLYRDIYTALGDNIPQIAQDMQDIQLIYAEGRLAKYRIRRDEEHGGQVYPITYYIYFVRDRDGLWKIYRY
ncbi:MAG: hypothetical protein JRI46_10320 [Deltaproteobacteria bacterium]|nr:hypothetical protein [Deltaproteobacteria bacterium]